MSDSLANLAVKVDVTSVTAAMRQLDGLAAKAGEIEKKVSNVGASQARVTKARKSEVDSLDNSTARMLQRIERVRVGQERFERAVRQSNVAQSVQAGLMQQAATAKDRLIRALNQEGASVTQITRANNEYNRTMRGLNDNLRDGNRVVNERISTIRRLSTETERNSARQIAAAERSRQAEVRTQMAIERTIQTARTRTESIIGRANRQLPAAEAGVVSASALSILARYNDTIRNVGPGTLLAARASGEFQRGMQSLSGEIARVGGLLPAISNGARTVSASFGAANASLGGFNRVLFSTSAALAALAGTLGLREITQAIMNFERFTNTLRTVSGTAGEYQRNLQFLFSEADRIGFSVGDVGNAFARLSIAMQGAGFTATETRSTFTGLAEAARNFGISSADTMGVIRALEQSMSKGKFMAEEVRLQMGDRLPVAMAALERAVLAVDGVQSDINKRFEEGTLDVQRYATEFVRQINIMSGGAEALSRTSNSISAAFGRLGTEMTRSAQEIGEGGFTNAAIIFTENIQRVLEFARESGALALFGSMLENVAKHMNSLAIAAAGVAAILAGSLIAKVTALVAGLSPLMRVITATAAALGLLSEVMSRTSGGARAADEFRSAMNNLNTSSERIRGTIAEFNEVLHGNTRAFDASASAIERRIQANRLLGHSESEAVRQAMVAEQARIQIELRAAERAEQTAQRQALQIRRNLSRELRSFGPTVENIQTELQNPRLNERGGAAQRAALEEQLALYERAQPIIRGFMEGNIGAADAVRQLGEAFRGADVPRDVERIRRALADAAVDDQFLSIQNQAKEATDRVRDLRSQVDQFREQAKDPITFRVEFEMNREQLALFPAPAADRSSFSDRVGTATRSVRDARSAGPAADAVRTLLGQTGSMSSFGNITEMTDRQLVQFLRTNERFRAFAPEVAAGLDQIRIAQDRNSDATAGARNALQEYLRDLQLQTEAAQAATGAERAFADARRRVLDASTNSRGSAPNAAALAQAELEVQRRLNVERRTAIAVMGRETAASLALSAAYVRGTQAGQREEVVQQARNAALETARENTAEYTVALRENIEALTRKAQAEANLNAARNIATMRDELEILQLENRLITANVNVREEELAVARALQQARGATPEVRAELERVTRQTVTQRRENQQLENSWNELSRIGEQAFERIGNSITEAFANGTLKALSFRNIAKAVFSEVAQAALRLGVINPVLNSLFGGTRPSIFGVVSASANGLGAASGGTGLSNLFGLGDVFRSPATGAAAGAAGGGMGGIENVGLLTRLGGMGGLTEYLFGGALGVGGMGPPTPGLFGTGGQIFGMPAASVIGGIGGLAGGAFGLYSGIQKGGIGGAVMGAGGVAGMAAGLSALTGIGASLAPILGPLAIALPLIGMLLPGQRPSSKMQGSIVNFGYENEVRPIGFDGAKFSSENRGIADQFTESLRGQERAIADLVGFRAAGGFDIRVGDERGDGPAIAFQMGGRNFENVQRFGKDEAGIRALSEYATQQLFIAFQEAAENVSTEIAGIVRGSVSLENLQENLNWFNTVYKELTNPMSEFGKQMTALEKSYDDAIQKAKELSLETDLLNQRREEETKKLQRARDLEYWTLLRVVSAQARGQNVLAEMINQQTEATKAIQQFEQRLKDLGGTASEVAAAVENMRQAQLRAQTVEINRNIRATQGTGFFDTINDLLQERQAFQQLRGPNFEAEMRLSDLRLQSAFRELSPTQNQFVRDRLPMDASVSNILNRVMGEMRDTAIISQRDAIDSSSGRGSLVQAREILRNFDQVAPQLGALGLTQSAWEALATQLRSFMSDLTEDQLRLLTAFDNVADKMSDDLVRLIAQNTLAQREAAQLAERRATAEERVIRGLSGLIDFTRSLQIGSLSALSPQAQFELAQSQFEKTARAAAGGDFASIERLPSYAESYLTTAREIFGSGQQYADVFGRVVGTLEGVAETPSDTLTASAMAIEVQTQTQTLVGELTRLREEVTALKNEVVQQGIRPTRVAN